MYILVLPDISPLRRGAFQYTMLLILLSLNEHGSNNRGHIRIFGIFLPIVLNTLTISEYL